MISVGSIKKFREKFWIVNRALQMLEKLNSSSGREPVHGKGQKD
jgi:hypothetical protein